MYQKKDNVVYHVTDDIKILQRDESGSCDSTMLALDIMREGKRKPIALLFGYNGIPFNEEQFDYNEKFIIVSSIMNICNYTSHYPHVEAEVEITLYDIERDTFLHGYNDNDNDILIDIFRCGGKGKRNNFERKRTRNL